MGEGRAPTLTRNGAATAIGALVLAVTGMAFGYIALTAVAAGATAALATGWLAARQVPNLKVERAVEPARVQRGLSATAVVSVRNRGRRRSRSCTAVDHVGGDVMTVAVPPLPPGRTIAMTTALPTQRRGAHAIGPLTIRRQDPFGLWRSDRPVGAVATLLVEPRILPIAPRPAGRTRHVEGPLSDMAPRGTQVFHSLREYVPGDDVRRVHWRSSARLGTLMVREHIDTSLPSTAVVLDVDIDHYADSHAADGFEEAVDVAASVVAAAHAHGFPVRLVTSAGEVAASGTGQRGQQVRDLLARIQPAADADLGRAATTVLSARDHDVIVIVAGRLGLAELGPVTMMARRFASSTLVTIEPPAGAGPRWPAGDHLSGPTAVAVLRRWSARPHAAATETVSA
ncbi:MAG: DUF58 domain-containing protein [Desertimonas sp.]